MHLVKTTEDTGTEELEASSPAPPTSDNDSYSIEINALLEGAIADGKLDSAGAAAFKERLDRNELSLAFARGYIGALHTDAHVGAEKIGAIL